MLPMDGIISYECALVSLKIYSQDKLAEYILNTKINMTASDLSGSDQRSELCGVRHSIALSTSHALAQPLVEILS